MSDRPTMTRRKALQLTAAGAAPLAAPWIVPAHAQAKVLHINSYGGVLESSWMKAFSAPFTAASGVEVKAVPPVSFAKLKAQVRSKNWEWDLTNLGDNEFAQAVHEGLLEKVDTSIVPVGKLAPGMVTDFGIKSYTLGTNIVYRKDKFPGGGPQSWADFWDVKKFPGDRCLFDRSFTCLAFALLADGVPPDKLYPMDVDRAFKSMDRIKKHIKVWWTQGTQSQQLIRNEVDMIGMWSARAIDSIESGVPLELVWNGAETYSSNWCVPKGNPNVKLAWQFIATAVEAKNQAEFTKLLPYGPSNPEALPLIPEKTLRLTPSWPDNARQSFRHDPVWLAPRLAEIRERWSQWITG